MEIMYIVSPISSKINLALQNRKQHGKNSFLKLNKDQIQLIPMSVNSNNFRIESTQETTFLLPFLLNFSSKDCDLNMQSMYKLLNQQTLPLLSLKPDDRKLDT